MEGLQLLADRASVSRGQLVQRDPRLEGELRDRPVRGGLLHELAQEQAVVTVERITHLLGVDRRRDAEPVGVVVGRVTGPVEHGPHVGTVRRRRHHVGGLGGCSAQEGEEPDERREEQTPQDHPLLRQVTVHRLMSPSRS